MVHAERTEVYRRVMGDIKLESTEGQMHELAEEHSLGCRIRMHNSREKALHVHDPVTIPVCCCHQYENGVRFMCISMCTASLDSQW
jgi:hypothetical protein